MCAQSCPTLCDPTDCSPPGSSVQGILQARILEWAAISSSRGSSWPRGWTHLSCVSCIGRQILYYWVTWEALRVGRRNKSVWLSRLIHQVVGPLFGSVSLEAYSLAWKPSCQRNRRERACRDRQRMPLETQQFRSSQPMSQMRECRSTWVGSSPSNLRVLEPEPPKQADPECWIQRNHEREHSWMLLLGYQFGGWLVSKQQTNGNSLVPRSESLPWQTLKTCSGGWGPG